MDLSLTEEQQLLQDSARDFLRQECPTTHVRAMEEDLTGYSPELWQKMTELGWAGLMFPEQYGGSGYTFVELCVLLEECGRAAQDRVVKIVAQVRNHAESSMIDEVGADVVEDSFENRGSDERPGDDGPGIVRVDRNKALQIDGLTPLGPGEQDDVFGTGSGVQDTVENGLEEDETEGLKESDAGQQNDSGEKLGHKRQHVADKADHLAHGAPARSGPQWHADGGIGMRCKALFYLSPAWGEWRLRCAGRVKTYGCQAGYCREESPDRQAGQ